MAGVPVILILHRWTLMFLMMVVIKSYGLQTQQCSCYYFYSYSMSRRVADFRCKIDHNSTFVSMETIEEWAFIKMQIQNRTTDKLGGNQWHIGLEEKNGEWKWSSGQNLTYNKWRLGMPDYQWNNRFGVMNSATGLFRTTNDINPQGRICERKSNAQELCAVRWCPSTLFTTTPMSSISTTLSDHNKRINTSHTVTVTSTQSIRTSNILSILLTTDHQPPSKAPSHAATKQNSDTTTVIVIAVVLVAIVVLFCIIAALIRCKRTKKYSRQKRKQQLQHNESIEMEPRENTGSSPETTAEYTEVYNTNQGKGRRNTCKGISMATDDGYASVDDVLNNDERNINVVEAEYAEVKDVLKNVRKNDLSIETEVGYATADIKGAPDNVRNNDVSLETETGYATVDKGGPSNANDESMETEAGYAVAIRVNGANDDSHQNITSASDASYASVNIPMKQTQRSQTESSTEARTTTGSVDMSVKKARMRSKSCSPDTTVEYAVVDKSKKRKRSESVIQSSRDQSSSEVENTGSTNMSAGIQSCSPDSSVHYAVVDKSKKSKRNEATNQSQRGQTVSIAEVENTGSMDVSAQNSIIHSQSCSPDSTVQYAVVDKSKKSKRSEATNQSQRGQTMSTAEIKNTGSMDVSVQNSRIRNTSCSSDPTVQYAGSMVDKSKKSKPTELVNQRQRDEAQVLFSEDGNIGATDTYDKIAG